MDASRGSDEGLRAPWGMRCWAVVVPALSEHHRETLAAQDALFEGGQRERERLRERERERESIYLLIFLSVRILKAAH